MLVAAGKAGIDAKWVRQRFPRVATVPFSSERKYMATLNEDAEAGRVVCAKGAVERIVDLCAWQMGRDGSQAQLDHTRVHMAAEDLARQGLRVLATAMARVDSDEPFAAETLGATLTLTGLHAMVGSSPCRGDHRRAVVSQRGHRRQDDHRRPRVDGRGDR